MNFFHEYHREPRIIHNQKIRFEAHLHYEVEIITLFRGKASLNCAGKEYHMEEGDFLIIFPNTVHSYTSGEDVDVGKFIFSPDTLPELKDIFKTKLPATPVIPCKAAGTARLRQLADEILHSYESGSPAVKKAYLLLLTGKLLEFCRLEDRSSYDGDTLNAVLEYCQNHFRSELRQKEVAAALHISESYLSHLFSSNMEINFCRYLNILRINEACALLSKGGKSVTEIAYECGFSSLRSFNRAFSGHRGMTPREYKKSLADN